MKLKINGPDFVVKIAMNCRCEAGCNCHETDLLVDCRCKRCPQCDGSICCLCDEEMSCLDNEDPQQHGVDEEPIGGL